MVYLERVSSRKFNTQSTVWKDWEANIVGVYYLSIADSSGENNSWKISSSVLKFCWAFFYVTA